MSAVAHQRPSHLSNLLATPDQLAVSSSQLDGISSDLQDSIRFAGARLTQTAGILLRLPQDIIAHSIVIFTRFWVGPEGGSFREHVAKDVSAAALYTTTKISACPRLPRDVLNVFHYLTAVAVINDYPCQLFQEWDDQSSFFVSEDSYSALRTILFRTESHILRVLGFDMHVALPHTLAINYLQVFGIPFQTVDDAIEQDERKRQDEAGPILAQRAFAHLNAALLSPQLLYLTHQPPQLAVAAVYLAARELGVKLPGEPWWEVFDVDREDLGFLVGAMTSMPAYIDQERTRWGERRVPLTLEELEAELSDRSLSQQGY